MDLYGHVTTRLFEEIADSQTIDFFLCGLCPHANRPMAAKFSIDYGDQLDQFAPNVQLLDEETVFPVAIGSGAEAFHRYLSTTQSSQSPMSILRALKQVIDDISIESVGGNIQYGELNPSNSFMIKGIVVPEFHKDGWRKLNRFFLGGIDVHDDIFNEYNGLYMTGSFLNPWENV